MCHLFSTGAFPYRPTTILSLSPDLRGTRWCPEDVWRNRGDSLWEISRPEIKDGVEDFSVVGRRDRCAPTTLLVLTTGWFFTMPLLWYLRRRSKTLCARVPVVLVSWTRPVPVVTNKYTHRGLRRPQRPYPIHDVLKSTYLI